MVDGDTLDQLPARPLVVVQPSRSWTAPDLREIWRHRELLLFLTWRDVKIRYKQTVLGMTWAALQPLSTTAVFSVLFGRLARMPSEGLPYPLFALAGLLPWSYFASSVSNGANSLVLNQTLVTKVYLPRALVPAAAVGAQLVDFAVACSLLAALMWVYGVEPTGSLAMLPVLVLLLCALALAAALGLSALNARYRDVRHALPFLIQTLLFLSPVIYPSTLLPSRWRWLLACNPLSGIIEGFRTAVFGRAFDWQSLAASALVTFLGLAAAACYFRRVERTLADVV